MIINYSKSEIIMCSKESGEGVANTFKCKSGSLLMLGIPASDVKLTKAELSDT